MSASPSLLNFLDAPVVVGDPDGAAAYVNPAFEARFQVRGEASVGSPLAALFDGGAREAVLRAVAEACGRGRTVRFRVRQAGQGYTAVASPITAEDSRVGVVMLLLESATSDERFLSAQRAMQEPLDELRSALQLLLEQTGGRRAERHRRLVEDGMRALERVQKWNGELHALLTESDGERSAAPPTLDTVAAVRRAATRAEEEFRGSGAELQVLLPAELPRARGDAELLEAALVRLLRDRAQTALEGELVTLAGRAVGRRDPASVVVSVVDRPGGEIDSDPGRADRELVGELVERLGGELRTVADPVAGRTSLIRLHLAR